MEISMGYLMAYITITLITVLIAAVDYRRKDLKLNSDRLEHVVNWGVVVLAWPIMLPFIAISFVAASPFILIDYLRDKERQELLNR